MPCYEYKCTICGHTEEYIRKFKEDKSNEICSKCGGVAIKTVSSPLIFFGDGYWERNNYENRSKHDLEEALAENDIHQRNYDKLRKEEEKAGIYQGD